MNTAVGRKIVLSVGSTPFEHAGGEADREAAEGRRPEPVEPADDDSDEHDDRLLEPVVPA